MIAAGGTALVSQVTRNGTAAVLKSGCSHDRETCARFEIEADVLRTIGPPTTPAYLAHGRIGPWPYLIMEHVPGETVAAWMSRNGSRGGLGEIVAILVRIAGALAALHAAHYVHRDLKPENIIIGPRGIRLLDFGLVKPMTASGPRLTEIGSIVGTPHYLAPEQIRLGSQVDPRADIYAFGVIAFEMFAGRPPFIGDRRAIEYNHLVGRAPAIAETRPIPKPLDDIVMACLAKNVEARPQTADQLRLALSEALQTVGTIRSVAAAPEPRREARPLGAPSQVALAWIECTDFVGVTRAITEVRGIVVHQRGHGLLAAFASEHHDAPPLVVALGACRPLVGNRQRIAIHVTNALVRQSAAGKSMVYGPEVEHPERWIPTMPFTGIVLTQAAAALAPDGAVLADDVPGFCRESLRDRTDATDARVDAPLIGRDPLLRTLVAAATERSHVLIGLSGATGAGKTRVLGAIADRLKATGREVVCVAGRRRFPGDRRDEERLVAGIGGGHDLGHALAMASARGAIIMVDNLDLLSASTRLLFLDPSTPSVRIVASREPSFEVTDFTGDRIALELPPLSHGDADALLREMLRPARLIPDTLVERLVIRGSGNPGLLVGLARDIKRRGAIRRQLGANEWYVAVDELDTLLAPPGASWFAYRVLEDLPVELAPIARRCAALGPTFSAAEVSAATTAADVDAHLGLLVREGLLAERNGWYHFADGEMQDAIYDHVLDERELVHRRVLAFWLATPDRNPIGRLARLAFHAAGAGERTTVTACWAELARYSAQLGDLEQVETLLERLIASVRSTLSAEVAAALASIRIS